MLKNRRILLISPSNYNYPLTIKEEIELHGGEVHFYDERNNPNSLEKLILRKLPFLMKYKIEKYYKAIAEKEEVFKPEYVLFISPEAVTVDALNYMRSKLYGAKFILYMWDSIKNKNAGKIYEKFDKCLSFDRNDCEKYGFTFRPLFFSREYDKSVQNRNEYIYDFGFIGTVHSDRANILYNFKLYCEREGLSYFFYLYVPSKAIVVVKYITDRCFRKLAKEGLIHTTVMPRKEVEKSMGKTRYVIDVNHPKQTGLTIRTIEMLGLQRKLVTTNENVKEYDFYNPVNQVVIDRTNISIDKNVIKQPYQTTESAIYQKYRVDSWIKEVFRDI